MGQKAANDFYDRIYEAIELLKSHPHTGAPSKKIPNARGLLIAPHNRLFYRIEKNKIIIVALADTRRKNYNR